MRALQLYLLLLLVIAGCDRKLPAPPPVIAGARFLALGDSYTIGESVEPADRWPVQLARLLREQKIEVADPQIIATTGWTTRELSEGIDGADPHGPYDLVALLIGVNNQFRGLSIDEFRHEFAALLARSVALSGRRNSRIIVLSIPDWGVTPFAEGRDRAHIGAEIDRFNNVCREECNKQHIAFIDITPISKRAANDSSLVADDGLHPSAKMYALWANETLPAAKSALAR